ncbi:hypothetical protein RHMOL_Rhmol06G0315100 [Rhododendron molle]|uniref:Uncharacterized protein n=2 Tax=Rhododendron molle TaxID=49168 RepID=A0ACC0NKB9_RHOML|nr:hypothetical protein RHMOL_Rhmol06G0315100 [Rhododendron molle]KAI8553048.1 hypothetical protein RHMOL_Rhmol06G0315100 [Rhododendron molle]
MNTRYLVTPDSLCNSGIVVSISSPGEDQTAAVNARNRASRFPPSSSFLIRTAMRVSRARWFSFLRRVFHYQNGSRSDLGSNPFNSGSWMVMELIALVVQILVTTYTLADSKDERPVWPMRIWVSGYDFGCVLSLSVLYGRYRIFHLGQGDGFGHSDLEQQRNNNEESSFLGYNMNMGSTARGASDDQISNLPSCRYKDLDNNLVLGKSAHNHENPFNFAVVCFSIGGELYHVLFFIGGKYIMFMICERIVPFDWLLMFTLPGGKEKSPELEVEDGGSGLPPCGDGDGGGGWSGLVGSLLGF